MGISVASDIAQCNRHRRRGPKSPQEDQLLTSCRSKVQTPKKVARCSLIRFLKPLGGVRKWHPCSMIRPWKQCWSGCMPRVSTKVGSSTNTFHCSLEPTRRNRSSTVARRPLSPISSWRWIETSPNSAMRSVARWAPSKWLRPAHRTACPALELVAPHLRRGAIVVCDNTADDRNDYRDYFEFIRSPDNGFRTMTLPFDGGLEFSVKCG